MTEKYIQEIIDRTAEERAMKIETYIKLHLKPKPCYLPYFIWYKILNRFLILEEFKERKNNG